MGGTTAPMPPTEAVVDHESQLDQEHAQAGGQVEQPKTPGEATGARQPAEGESPKAGSDDLVAEHDPLVLARKGPPEKAKAKPPAKTEPKPAEGEGEEEPAKVEQPGDDGERAVDAEEQAKEPDAKAKKPEPTDDDDDTLLNAKLSDEAWGKLSHKDKATFLGVQKAARVQAEKATKAEKEAQKFRQGYQAIDKFVADQGLDNDSFRNATIIAGMVARGDSRALPLLEESAARLRKAAGLPDPKAEQPHAPPAPAVSPDELLAAIEEAETSLDFAKARQLIAKLKATPPEAPPTRKPAADPKAAPTGAVLPDPAVHTAAAIEAQVNESVADYLTENGVTPDQVLPYLQGLIKADPALAKAPVQERLRAVMRAHSAARARSRPPAKPAPTLIRGQGRPGGGGGRTAVPTDPLARARTPGTPESRGGR